MIYFSFALLATIVHAYLDAQKIKRHEPIDHFWRSVVWVFVTAIPMIVIDLTLVNDWTYPFLCVLIGICIRAGFFDYALNKFRGLDFNYVSLSTNSFIDTFYRNNGINQNYIRIVFLIASIGSFIYLAYFKIY